jgi:hypothetical protein
MTQTIRLPALAGAIAAALCLATLTPSASREAVAQGIRVTVPIQTHYGSGYNRYSGYGSGRYGVGGYSGFRSSGYSGYGYGGYGGQSYRAGAYGAPSRIYSGYGNGPYVYGSPAVYSSPSYSVYGYSNAPTHNLQYRGLQYQGGSYRPLYNPSQSRLYSPYGYDRY